MLANRSFHSCCNSVCRCHSVLKASILSYFQTCPCLVISHFFFRFAHSGFMVAPLSLSAGGARVGAKSNCQNPGCGTETQHKPERWRRWPEWSWITRSVCVHYVSQLGACLIAGNCIYSYIYSYLQYIYVYIYVFLSIPIMYTYIYVCFSCEAIFVVWLPHHLHMEPKCRMQELVYSRLLCDMWAVYHW